MLFFIIIRFMVKNMHNFHTPAMFLKLNIKCYPSQNNSINISIDAIVTQASLRWHVITVNRLLIILVISILQKTWCPTSTWKHLSCSLLQKIRYKTIFLHHYIPRLRTNHFWRLPSRITALIDSASWAQVNTCVSYQKFRNCRPPPHSLDNLHNRGS